MLRTEPEALIKRMSCMCVRESALYVMRYERKSAQYMCEKEQREKKKDVKRKLKQLLDVNVGLKFAVSFSVCLSL